MASRLSRVRECRASMRRLRRWCERRVLFGVLALTLVTVGGCNERLANIVGKSMEPSLKDGESVLLTRAFADLERGDIIGYRYPKDESKSFIHRIVGVAGDRIQSTEGRVLLNGQLLAEPYVDEANRSADSWGPLTVPDRQYFVMGDNRRNSYDSRSWGLVAHDQIWAKMPRQ